MTLAQAYARLLAAAMVLIAVCLMPSFAWAHGSHGHPSVHAAAHQDHGAPKSAAPADWTVASQTVAILTALAPARSSESDFGCLMGCCGAGSTCCSGVMPVTATSSPPIRPQLRSILPRDLVAADGIDPDALRKPPRTFV